MPTMVREAWTDERLGDLANRMDEGFREVRAELRQLRAEMTAGDQSLRGEIGELRGEIGQVREELGEIRAGLDALNRTLQIGFGLIGSFLGVLGILFATQL